MLSYHFVWNIAVMKAAVQRGHFLLVLLVCSKEDINKHTRNPTSVMTER